MASNLEPVPITSQKHDPAWKHCQMFKNGDRVQLKCIYCLKMFKGGGIHRIKEHLACQKGNASTCSHVPHDVRLQMQHSLDGVVVKKRKKQKIEEEVLNVTPITTDVSTIANQVDVNAGLQCLPVPNAVEHNSTVIVNPDEGKSRTLERRKRVRGKNDALMYTNSEVVALDKNAFFPKKVDNHIHMAIGRFLYDIGAPPDVVNSVYFQQMIEAIASGGSVLNMVRRYTLGNDIVDPSFSRFATNFTTLKRMVDLKHNLQAMVTSQEWMDCPYSKQTSGLEMLDCISNQTFWSSCDLIVRLTVPLLRVLRITASEKRPAMGYVYAGMYRAKEAIKKELVKREDYMVYWSIIHHRIQDKIIKEINLYKTAAGDFGRKMAVRARDNLLPAEWWSTYGGGCPNLARLAVHILSQTCSAMVCKRNQIPFEQIMNTRNHIERQHLTDLVFVHYNLRLRQKSMSKEQDFSDPLSFESISNVDGWIRAKDLHLEEHGNSDWMTLDPSSINTMLLRPLNDETEELGESFDDTEIFSGMKDGDIENTRDKFVDH
ncbi:hypothetical protein K1719_023614 [Acacia pycnantha]|nr:hypothetical protein K1719_023614 [Acacia pycnantha]